MNNNLTHVPGTNSALSAARSDPPIQMCKRRGRVRWKKRRRWRGRGRRWREEDLEEEKGDHFVMITGACKHIVVVVVMLTVVKSNKNYDGNNNSFLFISFHLLALLSTTTAFLTAPVVLDSVFSTTPCLGKEIHPAPAVM